MAVLDVTTESGRHYWIDTEERLWKRISRSGIPEFTESIWALKVGAVLAYPWHAPELWQDADVPVVGKHLFISSRDVWYVSTKVVSIEEVS